jgi:hypothetical protein
VTLVASLFACTGRGHRYKPFGGRWRLDGAPSLDVPADGQFIFRHWTFGDEPFWTDTLT